jgi:glucose-6-phosphate isomerase
MINLKINIDNILDFISLKEIENFQPEIDKHLNALYQKTGKGNDFLSWINLPSKINSELIEKIKSDAKKIKDNTDIFILIGVGGSYLGARAIIEALSHNFNALLSNKKRRNPLIVYCGNNLSGNYLSDLTEILDNRDYSMVVISKSGTTIEPAIAFRILKNHIENKYGKNLAKERIIIITEKEKGNLKQLAKKENYSTYSIPNDIGGRYSVLTPVGLLPVAIAGFDIEKFIDGAKTMEKYLASDYSIFKNPAALYAVTRNLLLKKGKTIEIMTNYHPELLYLTEWWKQLFGESEGKELKGIFPSGANFTTDLHSMGQYIQEGTRNIFETILSVEENDKKNFKIPFDKENLDDLNYIAGKKIDYINKITEKSVTIAHTNGKVPVIKISVPEINEYNLGQLIYFFEMSCAISGYILGVNPFNQNGVEEYKKNMRTLLRELRIKNS